MKFHQICALANPQGSMQCCKQKRESQFKGQPNFELIGPKASFCTRPFLYLIAKDDGIFLEVKTKWNVMGKQVEKIEVFRQSIGKVIIQFALFRERET